MKTTATVWLINGLILNIEFSAFSDAFIRVVKGGGHWLLSKAITFCLEKETLSFLWPLLCGKKGSVSRSPHAHKQTCTCLSSENNKHLRCEVLSQKSRSSVETSSSNELYNTEVPELLNVSIQF